MDDTMIELTDEQLTRAIIFGMVSGFISGVSSMPASVRTVFLDSPGLRSALEGMSEYLEYLETAPVLSKALKGL